MLKIQMLSTLYSFLPMSCRHPTPFLNTLLQMQKASGAWYRDGFAFNLAVYGDDVKITGMPARCRRCYNKIFLKPVQHF